mgnify:CR=1 FL=1
MDWKLYTLLSIVLIVSFLAGFFISKNVYNKAIPKQETNVVIEKWSHDTTYVTKIIKQKSAIDTIYVKDNTGKDSVKTQVASIDTLFTQGQDSFKLGIKYFYTPENRFEYSFGYKKSLKEIYHTDTTTIIVKEPETFWKRFGVSAGLGVMIDEKLNVNRGLFIGISYKIF